nr:NAD(P)H-dependent oxidoreductase [Salmonella enterica]
MTDLPAIEPDCFDDAIASKLAGNNETMPCILILYGSVRQRSYSRFAAEEAGRLLAKMGAEVIIFNPSGLPSGCRNPGHSCLKHSSWNGTGFTSKSVAGKSLFQAIYSGME